jgi:hypothetical protein
MRYTGGFFDFFDFFGGVFVRFSTRGVQNSKTPQKPLGKSPCQKRFTKHSTPMEEKKSPAIFFLRFF